jgi:hypothetical protein
MSAGYALSHLVTKPANTLKALRQQQSRIHSYLHAPHSLRQK